jgi:hypothetical protein
MAKYFAALPLCKRKYSLGFAAVTGHMDYDVPEPETEGFAKLHKNDLMKKVKYCVAPEHFGTMEWKVDKKTGDYVATGRPVQYSGFGSSFKLQSLVRNAFNANNVSDAIVLTGPIPEEAGSALGWSLHGCPTVGGISLPDYLVNLDHGGPDKLNKTRFYQLASSYMSVIEQLLAGVADADVGSTASRSTASLADTEAGDAVEVGTNNRTFSFYDATGPHATKDHNYASNHSCKHVYYPSEDIPPPPDGWPVYQFHCGTGALPEDYKQTLEHIASHGFVAVGNVMDVNYATIPQATAWYSLYSTCTTRCTLHTIQCAICTHTFIKTLTPTLCAVHVLHSFEMIQANGMPVKVNPASVGVGGHSGGGPSAAILSSRYPAQVKAYVGQHAAAIPVVNRPSDEVIRSIKGKVLQLCGTKVSPSEQSSEVKQYE